MSIRKEIKQMLDEGKSHEEIKERYEKYHTTPVEKIQRMLDEGKSHEEIVEETGVAKNIVKYLETGVPKELGEKILNYHEMGLNDVEISKLLGKSQGYVTCIRKTLKLKRQNKIDIPKLLKLLDEGVSYEKIADEIDCSVSTIRNYASYFGYTKEYDTKREVIERKYYLRRIDGWRCVKSINKRRFKFLYYRKYENRRYEWRLNILIYQRDRLVGDVWLDLGTNNTRKPDLDIYRDFTSKLSHNPKTDEVIETLEEVINEYVVLRDEMELEYSLFGKPQN